MPSGPPATCKTPLYVCCGNVTVSPHRFPCPRCQPTGSVRIDIRFAVLRPMPHEHRVRGQPPQASGDHTKCDCHPHCCCFFFLFLFYLNIKSIWFYSMFIYIFHTMQRNEQSQPAPCLSCCVCLSRMVFIIVYMKHVIQCTTFLWHYLLRQSSLLGWGYNIVFRVERWYRIALHIHRTRVLCPPPMRYLTMCLSPVYLHIWFMTKY